MNPRQVWISMPLRQGAAGVALASKSESTTDVVRAK
jgi:hypothetical protein